MKMEKLQWLILIKKPFFDTIPENSISLLNLNTINDLSQKIDTEIEFKIAEVLFKLGYGK